LSSDLGKGTIVEIAGFETVSCPARHPGGPQLHSGLKRLRVAIMNKDPDLLSVTERLIQGWGCQTVPFDGDESAAPEADVLIADNDPELGETNVRSIAEFLGSADRQAIILSSSKTEEIQKSFKDGSVRILQKPVNPARLRSVLIALSISKTA
jgi:CheY-like chemotaxis protein